MGKIRAKIIGTGKFLPEKVLSNADLETLVETNDEWITERTGIKERRIADENTFTSDLAKFAAEKALKDANMDVEDVDLIITACVSPDMYTPSVSCKVQKYLGAKNAAAFDVNAACSGFVFAVTIAQQFIENGTYKNVLIIGAECLSKVTEYKDRATCVLFGDGAGAVVLQATDEDTGVITATLGSKGELGDCLTIPGIRCDEEEIEKRPFGDMRTIWQNGQAVFKFAVKVMASATKEVMEKAGVTIDDVVLIIPHQANQRIIDGAQKRLKCAPEKIFSNIAKYGNMSAACIPIALCEAISEGRIKRGDKFVIVGFGGGLTWGSALIEY
ncbi:MAG: beta-ketoacyl-ACP synthase III [Oscillospiraceae bacterium]